MKRQLILGLFIVLPASLGGCGLGTNEFETLTGHTGNVLSVSWSEDGTKILSSSRDGSVRWWDLESGHHRVQQGQKPGEKVYGNREGTMLAMPWGSSIGVWKATSKGWWGSGTLWLSGHKASVECVSWSPNGTKIASGDYDGRVRVFDGTNGSELLTFKGHKGFQHRQGEVKSVAWSPDGAMLASCGNEKFVRVWDIEKGIQAYTLRGHSGHAFVVSWSPDGSRIAWAGADSIVRVWKVRGYGKAGALFGHSSYVNSLSWSADGNSLASGSWNGEVRVWDIKTRSQTHIFSGENNVMEIFNNELAWDPKGDRLAICDGKTIKIWPISRDNKRGLAAPPLTPALKEPTVKEYGRVKDDSVLAFEEHKGNVVAIGYSPAGGKLASSGGGGGTVKVWDPKSGKVMHEIKGHKGKVWAVDWNSTGTRLVSGGEDTTVRIWDTANGKELRTLEGHEGRVTTVAWNPDGSRLASGGLDKTTRVWDVASGKEIHTLKGNKGRVSAVAWSPDGSRLASSGWSGKGTIRVWDASSGTELKSLKDASNGRYVGLIHAIAWSPDGTKLASGGGGGTVTVLETTSGEELYRIKGHEYAVFTVAWSPDGTKLASGCRGPIRVWDATNGKKLHTLEGHQKPVHTLDWNPDGISLASGGEDKTVRIWSIPK